MSKKTVAKKKRIWELDFWRGLAIILVVFDHMFYDFARIFIGWKSSGVGFLEALNEISVSYLDSDVRFFWRPAFLFLFFCVSGICTSLSKNNFLRGVRLWVVALCISMITYAGEAVGGDGIFVLFGVIHCLGTVILIYSFIDFLIRGGFTLTEKIIKKPLGNVLKKIINCILLFGLSAAFFAVNFKYNVRLYDVSAHGVYIDSGIDGRIFGLFFYTKEWWAATSDYFPIFPYICFFFFGAGLGKIFYGKKKTLFPLLDGCWHNVFTFAGRHSLAVYLLGQVVAITLGVLLSLVFIGDSLLFA